MATISFAGATPYQITVNIGRNNTTQADNYKTYRNGTNYSSNTFTRGLTHSAQVTFTGLSPSTQYYLSVTYYDSVTGLERDSAGDYFTTDAAPPPAPGTPVISGSPANNSYAPANVSFSWSASGATSYSWSSSSGSSGGGTSADLGLKGAGTYTINVTAYNAGGSSSNSMSITLINPPPSPPTGTPSVSATRGNKSSFVSWSGVSGATGYKVYANAFDGTGDHLKDNTSSSSTTITLDREYWSYNIKVVPYNSAGDGSVGSTGVTTLDVTSPTNLGVGTTTGFIWNAVTSRYSRTLTADADDNPPTGSDGASGINRYTWYKHNGTTYVLQGSGDQWTFDGLLADTNYSMGVIAVDNDGNITPRLNFPLNTPEAPSSRPTNWSWYTTKTSGADFSLTASEWNAFTTRINDFREYVGLDDFTFTSAGSGNDFTAAMFNQAMGAIGAMKTPPAGPTSYSPGDNVYAFLLNDIRDYLNTIP